jgi:hypothetical protein
MQCSVFSNRWNTVSRAWASAASDATHCCVHPLTCFTVAVWTGLTTDTCADDTTLNAAATGPAYRLAGFRQNRLAVHPSAPHLAAAGDSIAVRICRQVALRAWRTQRGIHTQQSGASWGSSPVELHVPEHSLPTVPAAETMSQRCICHICSDACRPCVIVTF